MTATESAPLVKQGGFTSVRLFVGFGILAGGHPDYALDPTFMADVRATVSAFTDLGLTVVVNFDGTIGSVDRFARLWRNIAATLADLPPSVFFELANEPLWQHVPGEPPDFSAVNVIGAGDWNALVAASIPEIRATNPERTVIVTSPNISFPQTMPSLTLPPGDGHLLATFHQYQPLSVTGQGFPGPTTWSGTDAELEAMKASMHDAVCWSRATGVPLVMSEFGIARPADAASRFAWTRAAAGLAEAEGISWMYFPFAGGTMGVYEPTTQSWVPELYDALFPQPGAPQNGAWANCPVTNAPTMPSAAGPSSTGPAAAGNPVVTPVVAVPRFTG
jgi:endoglucanase